MSGALGHVRHGLGSARAYTYGDLGAVDFVVAAFGAEVLEQEDGAKGGYHAEVRIGDAVVVIEGGTYETDEKPTSSIMVYVPDVDATHERALAAGATSIDAPVDKPYRERAGGVRDSFGNTWWISTYTG